MLVPHPLQRNETGSNQTGSPFTHKEVRPHYRPVGVLPPTGVKGAETAPLTSHPICPPHSPAEHRGGLSPPDLALPLGPCPDPAPLHAGLQFPPICAGAALRAHRGGLSKTLWALETSRQACACLGNSSVSPAQSVSERFVLVEIQEKTKQSTGDNRELPPCKPGGPVTQSVLCTEAPQAGPGCAGQSGPGCFHPQLPPNPQSPP